MSADSNRRVLLGGGSVLDAQHGEIQRSDVLIEGNRIVEVGDGMDSDDVVDCSELTLVPGLIDCHAHVTFQTLSYPTDVPPSYRLLEAVPDLRQTLALGITTVRDAWGADAGLRDALEAGCVDGPRLLISLAQLCGTGGIGDHFGLGVGEQEGFLGSPWLPRGVFDGLEGARNAVRRMIRSGADVIKVTVSGSATDLEAAHHQHIADDELAEIVSEAERHGRHVMAHAHGARTAEAAARAGARSIEHGWFLDDAAVEVMVESGTWLVPTLTPALKEESSEESPDWMRLAAEAAPRSFRLAHEAGVPIAMGTDWVGPSDSNRLDELRFMHQSGMGALDVWRSATVNAAQLLDRQDLGHIEPGRRADIVAIERDVMDFDNLASRVVKVWKDGRAVSMPASA